MLNQESPIKSPALTRQPKAFFAHIGGQNPSKNGLLRFRDTGIGFFYFNPKINSIHRDEHAINFFIHNRDLFDYFWKDGKPGESFLEKQETKPSRRLSPAK